MASKREEKGRIFQMKKSSIILVVVVAIIAIIGGMLISGYNGLVTKQENVTTALSNLDVNLQRRADLVPNLVSTVKGYAAHETEIIDKVTEARAKLAGANSVAEKSEANDELSSALNSLMIVVENYPDLKSSQNFINLSDELAGTENRIATSRRDYNTAVQTYNTSIKRFPTNILAGMFNFSDATYFEANEGSQEVPSVSF